MSVSVVSATGFQLPKKQRLVCAAEYQSVVAYNCKSKDALFVVYAQNNGRQIGRLGVTVSRRVAVRATERNRIKRAIKESFRCQQETLMGFDVVTIARTATRQVKTRQLFASLEGHWRRVNQQC